jgi:hypothetical protein
LCIGCKPFYEPAICGRYHDDHKLSSNDIFLNPKHYNDGYQALLRSFLSLNEKAWVDIDDNTVNKLLQHFFLKGFGYSPNLKNQKDNRRYFELSIKVQYFDTEHYIIIQKMNLDWIMLDSYQPVANSPMSYEYQQGFRIFLCDTMGKIKDMVFISSDHYEGGEFIVWDWDFGGDNELVFNIDYQTAFWDGRVAWGAYLPSTLHTVVYELQEDKIIRSFVHKGNHQVGHFRRMDGLVFIESSPDGILRKRIVQIDRGSLRIDFFVKMTLGNVAKDGSPIYNYRDYKLKYVRDNTSSPFVLKKSLFYKEVDYDEFWGAKW